MKAFIILAVAIACVMAAEETETTKTEKVFVGYPFGVNTLAVAKGAVVPAVTAYTAGYPYGYNHFGYPYSYGYGAYPYHHFGYHHVVV